MNKDWLDIAVLEDYLDGKLDAKTMHRVEREALEDPFVAEALAGLSESPKRSLNSISLLQKQLQERIAEQHITKKRSVITWQRLSIAATAAVMFIAVSVVFWMREDNRRKQMAALPKKVDVTIAQRKTEAPAKVAADKTPLAVEEAINAVKKETYASVNIKKKSVEEPVDAENPVLREAVVMASPETQVKQPAAASAQIVLGGTKVNFGNSNMLIGKVVQQDNGAPLPGVNLKIAGTNLSTVTDAQGKFTINSDTLIKGNIIANYIGFKPAEAKLNGNQPINLSLVADNSSLNEVVVVGYQAKTKSLSTGSAETVVSGKEIKDGSAENITSLLQGKVAGLNIQNNAGAPTAKSNIMIRGIGSASSPAYGVSEPNGGWDKFSTYLKKNNRFRNEAKIGQSVFLSFTVDKKGKPENVKVIKGIAKKYDQEAIRLILKGPKWAQPAADKSQLIALVEF